MPYPPCSRGEIVLQDPFMTNQQFETLINRNKWSGLSKLELAKRLLKAFYFFLGLMNCFNVATFICQISGRVRQTLPVSTQLEWQKYLRLTVYLLSPKVTISLSHAMLNAPNASNQQGFLLLQGDTSHKPLPQSTKQCFDVLEKIARVKL